MIENKLAFFEDDERFVFNEEKHEYYYLSEDLNSRIQTFRSATNLIEEFKEPFDSETKAKECSEGNNPKYKGRDPDEILLEWSTKGSNAAALGTAVHQWIEFFRGGFEPEIPEDLPETPQELSVKYRVERFKEIYEQRLHSVVPLRQEFRVFSRKWGIAGTMDDLGFVKLEDGLLVGDWKTNGKFATDEDFIGRFRKLRYPFEDLWDNDINKYSIQLSLYRLILEEEAGIETKEGFICWIGPEETKLFKTLDLRDRLRKYLNKNNLSI